VDPIRPSYEDAWVGALIPALIAGTPPPWLPWPASGATGVVLLVVDGLGWEQLQERRHLAPTLAAMEGGPITTTVPSTTSTGLTSIVTGSTPAEHGIVGYRMRVGGQVLNVLRWRGSERWSPEPADVQPLTPFLGSDVPVVTRAEFRGTGFTLAHLRGVTFAGYQTTATLVEHCRRLAPLHRVLYAYYDGPDRVAHAHGLSDGFFDVEVAAVDRLVVDLQAVLPPDRLLLVTSDHGQVEVGPDGVRTTDALDALVAARSGDARFRSLHARSGAAAELLAGAEERFGDVAWVWPRERWFDEAWLGRGASAEIQGRVGDVILAARDAVVFADPATPNEIRMRSFHGSLTPSEMLVPLLAASAGE
jgi:hypothetical protein